MRRIVDSELGAELQCNDVRNQGLPSGPVDLDRVLVDLMLLIDRQLAHQDLDGVDPGLARFEAELGHAAKARPMWERIHPDAVSAERPLDHELVAHEPWGSPGQDQVRVDAALLVCRR